ncbi:MAG TPA: L-fucose:H+ symporter permease [Arachidicoccus sp.]|nr:L-fucose:H+ symporter permease [Arachidicoccus sp.]
MNRIFHQGLFTGKNGRNYLRPFILITVLFLLWGFAHGLLDVLDKHFQDTLHVSKAESGFVQFSLYIGYLVMAYPAGIFMKKHGYKKGIILGLALFAIGAFLFYPAAKLAAFIPFLLALFVLACGLACLETAANPFTTVMGPSSGAARRINIAQSFNGLGWILGPLMGGLLIFGAEKKGNAGTFDSLIPPYMMVGTIVLVLMLIFIFTKLPVIKEENEADELQIAENAPTSALLKHPLFVLAVVAQFLYVAAQTGVNSFFINYTTEAIDGLQRSIGAMMKHLGLFGEVFMPKNAEQAASLILALGGMGSFWIGRLLGAYLMKFISPRKLLAIYGLINTLLLTLVVMHLGWISVIALFSTYFFMSIMFPTIFAIGLRGLGPLTKKAASFLVMAVAGGAFCPPIMGAIGDHLGMSAAFIIPLVCFLFIGIFGILTRTRFKDQFKEGGEGLTIQSHG